MKLIILYLIIYLSNIPVNLNSGTVKITVNGIQNDKGVVRIGLYNDSEHFPDFGKEFMGIPIKANKKGITYEFVEVPFGTYAISVWHDENSDEELNSNVFGIPKEAYGFSNNVYGKFGPPDFQDVSFQVTQGEEVKLEINLK